MLGHGQCLFTAHEFTIHIHVHMYIHDDAGPVVVGCGRHPGGGGVAGTLLEVGRFFRRSG